MIVERIDHIGIAVRSLDEALEKYKTLYGLEPIKIEVLERLKTRIAFIPVGEVLVELLEPTERGRGRIGQFLEKNGEGFHHIAYRVDDVSSIVDKLRNDGVPLRDEMPRPGADESKIAFIASDYTHNVLTELVERTREVH